MKREGRERRERGGKEVMEGGGRSGKRAYTCSINTAYTSRMSCSPEQGDSQSTQLGHCLATERSCGWSKPVKNIKIVVQLVWTVESK